MLATPKSHISDEEKAARALRARRRFRAVVRLVIANNAWLTDVGDQEEEGVSDNVAKNISMLTRKKRGISGDGLTIQEKSLLRKPVMARTVEEQNHLRLKLGTLKAFRRFPPEVKHELPTVMFFIYYPAGREIIRQGAPPMNMYVILRGEVIVSKKSWDRLLKCEVSKDLATLGAGSIFGEVSLMEEGLTRTATVKTLTACELLYVADDDFYRVFKGTVNALWNDIKDNMSMFSYFNKLNKMDITEACMLGKKKKYPEDGIILMNRPDKSPSDNVYFVIKGLVHMFEYMLIGIGEKNGKKTYTLLDDKQSKIDPAKIAKSKEIKMFMKEVDDAEKQQRVSSTVRFSPQGMISKWHFFKICSYRRLGSFNVGENLHNRIIVACSEVECLLLPRDYLDEKCDVTFRNIELYITKMLPTSKAIFKSFLGQKAWEAYKKTLVSDILKEKSITVVNSIHNVPYSIRLTDDLDFGY